MSKEQDLAKSIIQVAGCVSLPLEERVEMIKASARLLLKELMETHGELNENLILNSPMHEMANLNPESTGIGYVIWLGKVGGQHGPRIKVSNSKGEFNEQNNFVISVDKEPRIITPKAVKISSDDVDDVVDWIKRNYMILMELWVAYETGKGDVIFLLSKLEKI